MDKNVIQKVTQAMKPITRKRQGRSRLSRDALVGATTSGDKMNLARSKSISVMAFRQSEFPRELGARKFRYAHPWSMGRQITQSWLSDFQTDKHLVSTRRERDFHMIRWTAGCDRHDISRGRRDRHRGPAREVAPVFDDLSGGRSQ
jgi:hypothetical protein